MYVGNGESVSANSSENGGYVGNKGDQTGHEIEKHPVITFDKDWDYVLRPPDENEDNENDEEGDENMAMYNQPGQGMNGMYPAAAYNPQQYNPGHAQGMMPPYSTMPGYPQGNPGQMNGYPQGNLGQMNGYSQANAGGYPQSMPMQGMQNGYQQGYQMAPQGMPEDLSFVKGIEGAKNTKGSPNSRKPFFDEDNMILYVVSYGPQGNANNIRVFSLKECSEEMPQHLSPLMQHDQPQMGNWMEQQSNYITRDEFNELKEMLENAKPSGKPANESNASRNGQQSNGGRLNARTN